MSVWKLSFHQSLKFVWPTKTDCCVSHTAKRSKFLGKTAPGFKMTLQNKQSVKMPWVCFNITDSSLTLKTNISLLSMARVLKPPSQMFGLALGWDGLSPGGSLGGRVCLSGLRGSEGGWERGGGAVGKGLVGWGILSGGPGGSQRKISHCAVIHISAVTKFSDYISGGSGVIWITPCHPLSYFMTTSYDILNNK